MIQLPATPLPARPSSSLRRFQAEIDALSTYQERVDAAKADWKRKNVGSSATFRSVRGALTAMCSGNQRCCYCEDSCADEIEHIRPKGLYPETAFVWENYLYACGPCNVEKRNNYAVFAGTVGAAWIDVKRQPDAPVAPPPPGSPVLIDPRTENPLSYLILDLVGTFEIRPLPGISQRQRVRAEYTIKVLGLNDRDYLILGRRTAFTRFEDTLSAYVRLVGSAAAQDEVDRRMAAIIGSEHRTVWEEMKRWHRNGWLRLSTSLQPVDDAFAAVPEALSW
jgi:uncharacterized protein (TIGR02646 family)